MKKIFVVDDEQDILELVSIQLRKNGFDPVLFEDGFSMFRNIDKDTPDLIILDLMLPDMDGLEICRKLKSNANYQSIPILMLTAKDEEMDRILGLELGADDYVSKPFSPRELVARIKAILRRSNTTQEEHETQFLYLANEQIKIDIDRYELTIKNKKVELTTTEFKVLMLLTKRKGWVYSRQKILDFLWGKDKIVLDRTVDVHIKNLRDKLGVFGNIIKNIRGVGYKIEE